MFGGLILYNECPMFNHVPTIREKGAKGAFLVSS